MLLIKSVDILNKSGSTNIDDLSHCVPVKKKENNNKCLHSSSGIDSVLYEFLFL